MGVDVSKQIEAAKREGVRELDWRKRGIKELPGLIGTLTGIANIILGCN